MGVVGVARNGKVGGMVEEEHWAGGIRKTQPRTQMRLASVRARAKCA